ncbi:zinc finger, C3HC4 type (RING finger) protein [Medicago truncatula]|uniref:Zinc finger, C3HC4 type (RING finger) protein n=1 Tax=Medicago truncatula TaxID=3880 RepID=G7IZ88_MEDTR|nr:zinc finger, C3HC4 type (RING finger) protein [Medicago truncatula]
MKSKALTCSICLVDLSVGSIAIQLSCSHLYHEECVVKWLDRSNTFPLCRRIVSDFSL